MRIMLDITQWIPSETLTVREDPQRLQRVWFHSFECLELGGSRRLDRTLYRTQSDCVELRSMGTQ